MRIQDLLGVVAQSGLTRSSTDRLRSSLGGGGLLDSLGGMLGGGAGGGYQGGGAAGGLLDGLVGGQGGSATSGSGVLGSILGDAGRLVGGNKNLAIGGLGALAGALMGGSRRGLGGAVRGGLGGGVMAVLGAMAFQALKNRAGQQTRVPLGLAEPQTPEERAQLERNAELVLKAMINAAKADGRIDEGEISRLIGKVQEGGADQEELEFLKREMAGPMETAELVAAAKGEPELAAELYGASLLAIEVDTPAEQRYLQDLAASLGLEPEVTRALHRAVGLEQA
ncbi:MAG: tellurite resistance TerB family protein [Spirochaetales bacterium]|nr:tellurite resistance TerB family protein [Spirochaetales bacterium]